VLVVVITEFVELMVSTEGGRVTEAVVVQLNVNVPSPVAVHVNSTLLPVSTATLSGGSVMSGGPTRNRERGHNAKSHDKIYGVNVIHV